MSQIDDILCKIERWTKPPELESHKMLQHGLGEWVHWKDVVLAIQEAINLSPVSWAVRRPYCNPQSLVIVAYTAEEAISIANLAFGYCSDTTAVRP